MLLSARDVSFLIKLRSIHIYGQISKLSAIEFYYIAFAAEYLA